MEVDRSFSSCTDSLWQFTQSLLAVRKVDRSLQKVSPPHGKLIRVDEKSPSRTQSRQKLTEGLQATWKVDRS